MSQDCVVAVYESFAKAKEAVQALENSTFPSEQVSFVTHSVTEELPQEDSLQYGDKTERNAARGAGVGGLIGMLLGTPLVTVGGLGAVLIAGPIATGLAGAIVGGLLGAMTGWGVHADHVHRYEKKVSEGALLVVANGDPQQVAEATKVLQQTDADEIHLHAETSADSVSP
jgi:hypothetical protein